MAMCFTCSLVGGFSREFALIATVLVYRGALGPGAGDLDLELEQSLQFHDGSCLDSRGQFHSPSVLWLLGEFLKSQGYKLQQLVWKNRKNLFQKKIIKIFFSYRKQRFQVFVHTLNKNCEKSEFPIVEKY